MQEMQGHVRRTFELIFYFSVCGVMCKWGLYVKSGMGRNIRCHLPMVKGGYVRMPCPACAPPGNGWGPQSWSNKLKW